VFFIEGVAMAGNQNDTNWSRLILILSGLWAAYAFFTPQFIDVTKVYFQKQREECESIAKTTSEITEFWRKKNDQHGNLLKLSELSVNEKAEWQALESRFFLQANGSLQIYLDNVSVNNERTEDAILRAKQFFGRLIRGETLSQIDARGVMWVIPAHCQMMIKNGWQASLFPLPEMLGLDKRFLKW
jgi:hypothetical protein